MASVDPFPGLRAEWVDEIDIPDHPPPMALPPFMWLDYENSRRRFARRQRLLGYATILYIACFRPIWDDVDALAAVALNTGVVLVVVDGIDAATGAMSPKTLGANDEGGFAVMPAGTVVAPQLALWGVPIYRDPRWPSTHSTKAIVGNSAAMEVFTDGEYRLDVSSEVGNRSAQNVTGFRAEELFGSNATPYWVTGHYQVVTGL